jgi:hypothetical protein
MPKPDANLVNRHPAFRALFRTGETAFARSKQSGPDSRCAIVCRQVLPNTGFSPQLHR